MYEEVYSARMKLLRAKISSLPNAFNNQKQRHYREMRLYIMVCGLQSNLVELQDEKNIQWFGRSLQNTFVCIHSEILSMDEGVMPLAENFSFFLLHCAS